MDLKELYSAIIQYQYKVRGRTPDGWRHNTVADTQPTASWDNLKHVGMLRDTHSLVTFFSGYPFYILTVIYNIILSF